MASDNIAGEGPAADKDVRTFPIILAGLALTIAASFVLGFFLKAPPLARFSFDLANIGAGALATAPLIVALIWFMQTKHKALAASASRRSTSLRTSASASPRRA